jgi:hypothetical protein
VTLADAGLLSVPVPERNQGFGISCRGEGRPEGVVGLAAGETQVRVVRPPSVSAG